MEQHFWQQFEDRLEDRLEDSTDNLQDVLTRFHQVDALAGLLQKDNGSRGIDSFTLENFMKMNVESDSHLFMQSI